jgi:hypothetical protein
MSLFDSILPINGLNNVVNSAGNVVRDAFGIGATKSNGTVKSYNTLDKFKSEVLGKGQADESRFELMVSTPKCLSGATNGAYGRYMQASNIRVEHVTFPAMNLITKQRKIYGAPEPMPVGMDYGGEAGILVTYLCDRDMNVKSLFDAWMSMIVDTKTQTVAYPDSYTTSMDIMQLDRLDWCVYTTHITGAYPKSVSQMQGNSGSNQFQRFTVTYAYRKWENSLVSYYKDFSASQAVSSLSKGGDVVKSVTDQINQRASNLAAITQKYGLTTSISPISL